jgi:TolA-binding protein
LIDKGANDEALRRLDKDFHADSASLLSEERDALYVQALARAQRRDEARALARQFLVHYPHSPYFETMRQLLGEE